MKKHEMPLKYFVYNLKAIRDDVALMRKDYLEFKQEVRTSLARFDAIGSSYVSDFFPAEDNQQILDFLKEDKKLKKRKDSLYLLLTMTSAADTDRKFSDMFLRTLFSKKYLAEHMWPHGR